MSGIADVVEHHGLKLSRIAELAGLRPETVGRAVSGRSMPELDTCRAIVIAIRELTGRDLSIEELWPAEVGNE